MESNAQILDAKFIKNLPLAETKNNFSKFFMIRKKGTIIRWYDTRHRQVCLCHAWQDSDMTACLYNLLITTKHSHLSFNPCSTSPYSSVWRCLVHNAKGPTLLLSGCPPSWPAQIKGFPSSAVTTATRAWFFCLSSSSSASAAGT